MLCPPRCSPSRLAGVLALLVCVSACRTPDSGVVAEQFRADVAVLADGSVAVEETWQVLVRGGTPVFDRHVHVLRHDGVFAVEGALEGEVATNESAGAELAIEKGPALDVRWKLSSREGARHTFVLRYRAAGTVEISGIRGTTSFRLLEPRGYDVTSAAVTLKLPPGAVMLGDPWVEEAGWAVERRADGLHATRRNIERDESATVGATFTIDTMMAAEPVWQTNRRRARDLVPAFASSGVFLLVVGAGIVAMVRLKYPSFRPGVKPATPVPLTDDVAQALVRRRYSREMLSRLIASGLADPERVHVVRDLRRAGVATLLFGALIWAVTATAFDEFGQWPLAIPAGILAAGLMFIFAAHRLPILSQNGVEARERVLYSARVRDGRTSA